MKATEKLKNLIENELLPDLEAEIDALFAKIDQSKQASAQDKSDLEELREMRTECFAIIEEIGRDEMEESEAQELLDELVEIKTEDN